MSRSVVYLQPDGSVIESRPDGAILADPQNVVDMWRKYSPRIPAQFALGTAQHEADLALNEQDTEDSGFISTGIYQLSREEAVQALVPLADLTDLEDSTKVFATIQEHRLDQICEWAGIDSSAQLPADVWAYLALAHNQGPGAAQKTIQQYGLDWAAYKARNPSLPIVAHGYGDDVISGGKYWQDSFGAAPVAGAPSAEQASSASTGFATRIGVLGLIAVLLLFFLKEVL